MPRHSIIRSEKEIEEIKRIRRQRNTEIQRARRQKLREAKKEKEILMNNLIKSDSIKKSEINNQTKEKRKLRNTELQRLRRANLHIPRQKKTIENGEDYLARRRKRNTEIQRLRRQKLKQQREEKSTYKNLESENNNFTNTENFDASTILTLIDMTVVTHLIKQFCKKNFVV
jgi:hypothetical protein